MMSPPTNIRRIGVLTGGGDCPGLNAVIRAVVKTAILQHGIEVAGIEDGFQGLIDDRVRPLSPKDVAGILVRGGTVLGSNNRCNPRRYHVGDDHEGQPVYRDVTDRCVAVAKRHQLDAIIVIGGDGTMAAASSLVDKGLNVIGVPKTIDNDIVGTEISFGFLTAVNTATDALDKLHSTADSHHRVMVCELMGRNAGWITLTAFELESVAQYIDERMNKGPGFAIVAVAEGARMRGGEQVVARMVHNSPDPVRLGGIGQRVADGLAKLCRVETRTTVLGHIQRGGTPIPADRILATHFGYHAIQTLMSGGRNRMVVRQNNIFGDVDLLHSAGKQRLVNEDHPLISAARALGTSFGDGVPHSHYPDPKPAVVV
jgi:6-phosphofructokinase 1